MSHHILPPPQLRASTDHGPLSTWGPQAGTLPVAGAGEGRGSEKEFGFKMKRLGTSLVVQW